MSASDFVKSKIDELICRFTNIRCRYEYDSFSNTHLIEVMPISVYKADVDYAQFETLITDEFIEKFPNESICFISEDSLVSVENPIYIKKGVTHDIMEIALEKNWTIVPLVSDISFFVPKSIRNVEINKPELIISGLHSFEMFERIDFPRPYDMHKKLAYPLYSVLPQFNYKVLLQPVEEIIEIDSPSDTKLPLAA